MRKGTTPSFVFELPIEVDTIKNAKVIFSFNNDVKLEKYLKQCAASGNKLTVKLTQEETFLFECNATVKIQLRVVTVNGDALASDVFSVFVHQCLDDEVIE